MKVIDVGINKMGGIPLISVHNLTANVELWIGRVRNDCDVPLFKRYPEGDPFASCKKESEAYIKRSLSDGITSSLV